MRRNLVRGALQVGLELLGELAVLFGLLGWERRRVIGWSVAR